jgi:hypothetical protein
MHTHDSRVLNLYNADYSLLNSAAAAQHTDMTYRPGLYAIRIRLPRFFQRAVNASKFQAVPELVGASVAPLG